MNRRIYISLVASLLFSVSLVAQDAIYTLASYNPLGTNPAFAHPSNGQLYFASNSRQQWWGLPGVNGLAAGYNMNQASIMAPFISKDDIGLGGGLQLSQTASGAGKLKLSEATFTAASRIGGVIRRRRNNMSYDLGVGVGVGFKQFSLDWDQLTFSSQLDPFFGLVNQVSLVNPNPDASNFAPIVNTGIKASFTHNSPFGVLAWKIGGSAYQWNKPSLSFFDENALLQRRYVGHISLTELPGVKGGVLGNLHATYFILSHRFYYQYPQFTQETRLSTNLAGILNISTGVRRRRFLESFENYDAVLVAVEVITPFVMIGAGYDFTISELNSSRTGGTTEISLRIPLGRAGRAIGGQRAEPCHVDYILSNSEWKAVGKFNNKSTYWGSEYSPITFQF